MAGLENLRVARLVLSRVGKGEDKRYRELRSRWRARGREQSSFFVFYQAQALVAAVLSSPILLAAFDPDDAAGATRVGRGGPLDRRRRARARGRPAAPALQGRPGEQGADAEDRPLALLAPPELLLPVADLGRLRAGRARGSVRLDRIDRAGHHALPHPLRHRRAGGRGEALRSRGEEYRRYQRETSAFVPWFPRERRA